jgi:hypothetical protein
MQHTCGINQKITIFSIYLAELMCRTFIRLLEGPILLLPCPCLWFAASVDAEGFKEFLLDASKECEVEGIVASPKIYKNNKQHIKIWSLNTSLFHKFET